MKIVLTGGGTAGHFYPLIAIAEALIRIATKEKLLPPELFYMSEAPYDKKALFDNNITFKRAFSGKMRRYFSFWYVTDAIKLVVGILQALWHVYKLYPDVVISKGGYASVPVVFAARVFRIPVFVHESDSIPGKSNLWAARFASRIAVSWDEAASSFPKEKTAVTGQPIRSALLYPITEGAFEYLKLEEKVPVVLVLGGSLGAQMINDSITDALPDLLPECQVIHQTGVANVKEVRDVARVAAAGDGTSPYAGRYKPFGFLNELALRMSYGVSTLVISRAGSTIFEIAAQGLPSIIVPITSSNGDHQRKNAFNYARTGAAVVIEEKNLTPHILVSEIKRLLGDQAVRNKMRDAALRFSRKDSAETIAREVMSIALSHER